MVITDGHLIERTLAGSQPAFGQLIGRYQNFVFSLCMRVLKQREEAEEAAQDAFIKVYHSLHSFKEESRFSTWLYTLTYRTALDRARKKKLLIDSLDEEESTLQISADRSSNADQALLKAELSEYIEQWINQLNETDAMVVTLFYLQEQSVKEIAHILQMTETNVKTKLFRAREALRKKARANQEQTIQQYI